MKTIYKTSGYTFFLSALVMAAPVFAESPEVNFACMKEQVRAIIQVTDQHREFDVVIRNQCPGNAYWAMCIERLDPWTFKTLETHTPSGYVEAEKKARVNLQMKATPDATGDISKAQAFYVNIGYAIEGHTSSTCQARQCEAKKKDLRAQANKNNEAWNTLRKKLQAQADSECPDNGWNSTDADTCRQAIMDAAAEDLEAFKTTDAELQEKLAAVDPDNCKVYGGDVLELKKSS